MARSALFAAAGVLVGLLSGLGASTLLRPDASPMVQVANEKTAADRQPNVEPATEARATGSVVRPPRPPHKIPTLAPVESLSDVLTDIADLEAEREQLIAGPDGAGSREAAAVYAPTGEDLRRWADCAQVPGDVPSPLLVDEGDSGEWFSHSLVGDGLVGDGTITEDEREQLTTAAKAFRADVRGNLSEIYSEATGDPAANSMTTAQLLRSLGALQSVVDSEGLQRRFVAEERAGVAHRPDTHGEDFGSLVPYYRTVGSLGDQFEATIAEVVGARRAARLRADRGGWGSRIKQAPRCSED